MYAAVVAGQQVFMDNCAVCHGADGRGAGIVAGHLEQSPTDLTKLTANNDGHFPFAQIYETIDGRRQMVHAVVDERAPRAGDPAGRTTVHTSSATGARTWHLQPEFVLHDAEEAGSGPVSPLPGTVIAVHVATGDAVADGSGGDDPGDPPVVVTAVARPAAVRTLAARVLDRPEWIDSAERALNYLIEHHWCDGRLLATSRDGVARLNAYLDDPSHEATGRVAHHAPIEDQLHPVWPSQIQVVPHDLFEKLSAT